MPIERGRGSFTIRRMIMNALKHIAEVVADYFVKIIWIVILLALLINIYETSRPLGHNEVRLCNDWSVPPRCFVVTVTASPLPAD